MALVFLVTVPAAWGGGWAGKAPMPTARWSAHAGVLDGMLYVVGGSSAATLAVTEAYDPATNTWVSRAPLPRWDGGEAGRYSGAAGVIDGKLYLAGGWRRAPALPSNILQIYDPASNSWSRGANIPILSGCSVAGVIDGKLYVVTACDGYSGTRMYLHVYDPGTDSWSGGSRPPHVFYGAAVVIEGKLYAVGGNTLSATLGTLDVYDPMTDTWETRTSMPTPRTGAMAGVLTGKIHVVGGHDGTGHVDLVEVYDPASDTWTTSDPMPTARHSGVAGVLGGCLAVAGGAGPAPELATLDVYCPETIERQIALIEAKLDGLDPERGTDGAELEGDAAGRHTALTDGQALLAVKVDGVQAGVSAAHAKIDLLEGKADAAETALDYLKAKADAADTRLDSLGTKVDAVEAKLDGLEDGTGDVLETLEQLGAQGELMEAKSDAMQARLDELEAMLRAQSDFAVTQALLDCACSPDLYLPEALGGRMEGAQALARALLASLSSSGDPDEAPDLDDAACYLTLAEDLAGLGRYKASCRALSSAVQLMDGQSIQGGGASGGHAGGQLCLPRCEAPPLPGGGS
jgi:N-acetylneuraminic acid mutarotase